jgi:magnesium chelatase family protein
VAGELTLEGLVRQVRGLVAASRLAKAQDRTLICARCPEASLAASLTGAKVLQVHTLGDAIAMVLEGIEGVAHQPASMTAVGSPEPSHYADWAAAFNVSQANLDALRNAVAAGRAILLVGPPGCGRTAIAQRLGQSFLPATTHEERLDIATVHDAAGLRGAQLSVYGAPEDAPGPAVARPFRAPHHSISLAGMIGNAAGQPGEATLAHNGVLFLDELPEFQRVVVQGAVAAWKEGEVSTCRPAPGATFPTRFTLVMASNPCPCGYLGHPTRTCACTPESIDRHIKRIASMLEGVDYVTIQLTAPDRREALRNLTALTEELGGYDKENA